MTETPNGFKETTTKDLSKFFKLERTIHDLSAKPVIGIGIAAVFLSVIWLATHALTAGIENQAFIVAAGVIGGYMALNIGANDVANNVGPAFGAKSLTMLGALVIAAIFETSGALIAGGDVVKTISKGIIDPALIPDPKIFLMLMMSALLAAALWINFATVVNAPVSTTHSIVGGVLGAGVAAAGLSVVNWAVMGKIAASWVISPVLGGVIAALFLAFIKKKVLYQKDTISAAKKWVPILVALMAGVFAAYLSVKGLKKLWKPEPWMVAAIGAGFFAITYAIVKPVIAKRADGMENTKKTIRNMFHLPLICAAALLSFAHGANDVANAVGPLAAIVAIASTGAATAKVGIPPWVMFVGAAGITMGLLLFGPKLIRTVGTKITRMNPMRAYCVALSAAITVIVASGLGLPVSSTHIAVGAVFGIGFFREFHGSRGDHMGGYEKKASERPPSKWDLLPSAEKARRKKLVRRQYLWTIIAAWVITVPLSAMLSSVIFFALKGAFG